MLNEIKQTQTYDQWMQDVYEVFQAVTGEDWSKAQLDFESYYNDGLSPSDAVTEELSYSDATAD